MKHLFQEQQDWGTETVLKAIWSIVKLNQNYYFLLWNENLYIGAKKGNIVRKVDVLYGWRNILWTAASEVNHPARCGVPNHLKVDSKGEKWSHETWVILVKTEQEFVRAPLCRNLQSRLNLPWCFCYSASKINSKDMLSKQKYFSNHVYHCDLITDANNG